MNAWDDTDDEIRRFRATLEEAKAANLSPHIQAIIIEPFEEMLVNLEQSVKAHITNGTQARGRIVPPLPEHTFKDSGITIKIRKVGPTTQNRLRQVVMKDHPEPQPPTVETELGSERNVADPSYIAAKEAWDLLTQNEMLQRMMLIAALEAEVTIDDQARADIARKKRHLTLIGIPYEDNPDLTDAENEKVFYILYVAAATPEDLGEFSHAVLRRSVPTEDAVQAQIATFQRDVSE